MRELEHPTLRTLPLLVVGACLLWPSPASAGECGDPCTVTATVPDIHLVDTSSSTNSDDWEIRTEDGLLRMGRLAGNQQLFTLEIDAPTNTLHVDSSGRIGINTAVPARNLHINSTFPTIRLDDTSSSAGFVDLALHGSTFSVNTRRDGLRHDILAIDTRADHRTLVIDDRGRVGVGGGDDFFPGARFHVFGDTRITGDVASTTLHVFGDARIRGDVALGSSRTLKTDFHAVEPAEVLAKLTDLPVASWRYKTEEESARHIGPFAEDFQRLFGLGDGETISMVDAQGVALAAIQGVDGRLDREVDDLRAAIASLTDTNLRLASENANLQERLETLAEVLGQLGAALSRHRQEPSDGPPSPMTGPSARDPRESPMEGERPTTH